MKLRQTTGTILFWLTWPLLYVYVKHSERTRVFLSCRNKVLVVRGWYGTQQWSLPGGGLHKGEKALDGALRELREETGLTLSEKQLRFMFKEETAYTGLRWQCYFFVGEMKEAVELQAQRGEIAACAWVEKQDLNPKNAAQDVMRMLEVTGGDT